jgi:signal transduction histidine kinase/CheY-like chemotaxis protein
MYEHLTFCFPERLPDSSVVPVISCEDIAANPEEAFRPLLAVNVSAYICAPLYVEGKLWGVILAEQVSEPRQWTKNEKLFVGLTASTLAGVIMRGIYNTMLNEALNKATEASKAKGEFLSHMSHEIRTPLNAIIGMTGIGKNSNTLDKKNYALNRIEDASTHLLGVINDILDMSKIEANKLELSSIEFNFEKMVQRVLNIISFRIDQKQQTLATNIGNNIPRTLIGDDQRLAQVITNLLGNAIKFTPEKGVINLDASLEKEENGLYTIKISVTDNGIGITAEQQKKLFQSFQQAESDTVRKYGGTGLGLAISKSIVEAMGGRIWVQSEAGKGSTFAFTIKAKRGEKHEAVGLPMDKSDVSILIADDDRIILEYFNGISKKIGIHCDTAENGAQALSLVEQNGDYNIYFLDLNMPDIDGIKLAREIKSRTAIKCEVILITGDEWNTDVEEAKKAGIDMFLSKPLFPSVIEGVINEHLGVLLHDKETDITRFTAGRRVLLVEDMEINREIIMALLEPTQLEIECVDNGIRAVHAFENAPDRYDLIFMDIQMPEMDGYEATRYIRALNIPKAKTIPIIAMTANVFKEDIEKCLAAGMSGHVGKPINYKDVTDVLEKFLAPKSAPRT